MVVSNTAVYRFRWLLYELVLRDLTLRYRGSILGFAWTLLNPLLFMLVYTLVFSMFLHSAIHDYPLFLLSGLIPWMWFSGGVTQATTAILDGRAYVGKTLMPTELLVLVPVLSNGVNFLITVVLLLPAGLALGINVAWAVAFMPLLVLIVLCLTLGISLFVATANVFYRDLQQIVSYALTAGFFLTPIFYSRATIPPNLQFLVTFNPVADVISAFQSVLYKGVPPDPTDLLYAGSFAVIVLIAALLYFNSVRDSLGEQL